MKEKKYRNLVLVAFVLAVVLSLVGYKLLRRHEFALEDYKWSQESVTTTGYIVNIDDVVNNGETISISGWLIKEGVDIGVIDRYVVVKNTETQESFKVPTEVITRPDLKTYLNDGVNYEDSGFFAVISLEELTKNTPYEVYIVDASDEMMHSIKILDTIEREGQ